MFNPEFLPDTDLSKYPAQQKGEYCSFGRYVRHVVFLDFYDLSRSNKDRIFHMAQIRRFGTLHFWSFPFYLFQYRQKRNLGQWNISHKGDLLQNPPSHVPRADVYGGLFPRLHQRSGHPLPFRRVGCPIALLEDTGREDVDDTKPGVQGIQKKNMVLRITKEI